MAAVLAGNHVASGTGSSNGRGRRHACCLSQGTVSWSGSLARGRRRTPPRAAQEAKAAARHRSSAGQSRRVRRLQVPTAAAGVRSGDACARARARASSSASCSPAARAAVEVEADQGSQTCCAIMGVGGLPCGADEAEQLAAIEFIQEAFRVWSRTVRSLKQTKRLFLLYYCIFYFGAKLGTRFCAGLQPVTSTDGQAGPLGGEGIVPRPA